MLGEKLVKLRKKQGMSQQQVAAALGVTRQTVSNWECDQGAPAFDKASALARLYGVSLDDLVADEVEVVALEDASSDDDGSHDLHVLKRLEGKECRICYRTSYDVVDMLKSTSMPEKARVLSVSDDWLRVEHELGIGSPWSKKETAVRLIDVSLIDSMLLWPDEDEGPGASSREEAVS
ncbi:helix-turn-helix transcriptional regulator [Arabiibacter massiliensis]|uniref:helix-turn-helix transcriptional regulator n=1 Tax=Arabiibacter massiliensis TaxID=1870985 RepID=UPI0009B9C1F5|nr:helix-turn-helix transcriptional regulator [Arabiibacter massiliensis]